MSLRYFVGTPEDAFRKRSIVFTTVQAADLHSDTSQNDLCNTLFVYGATGTLQLGRKLLLIVDLDDLCKRYDRFYRRRGISVGPDLFLWFEQFVQRLLRYRKRIRLKEAA